MFLFKKSIKNVRPLIAIDFNRPWWYLIANQKWLFVRVTFLTSLSYLFWHIMPFLISYLFEHASITSCTIFFVIWFLIDYANIYGRRLNARFQLQCIHSIHESAHQHLLTIDPRYHIHRSSGAILGKIDRAARGYEDLLDQITFEFIPLVLGLITMTIAVSCYSGVLAVTMIFFFIAMFILAYFFAYYWCQPWEKNFIATDDAFRETVVENLAQVHLVRATFASDYMHKKLHEKICKNMHAEGGLWLMYTTASFVLNVLHACSIFILTLFLVSQIRQGSTTIISAIGLTVAYIQCTHYLTLVTKPMRRYMRGWTAVKDLFEFIPHFGKQTFPVLSKGAYEPKKSEALTLSVDSMTFDYGTGPLFNGHNFFLKSSIKQHNKLFGIIGESGKGKTTFIQILGGQLKPIKGSVIINDIDIYAVDDQTRRHLIALQGQVATTVRGTVRYNLLFGLPETHDFDDSYMRDVLDRVGLLQILNGYEGLDTMLGEGGLNISGGQRQRLNFASLYIRATYYKPALILIDEPTSSLDEVSEAAITRMIEELSTIAITLVIAHRLHTLKEAAGLIDLSLLDQEHTIKVYESDELIKRSAYYAQLMHKSHDLFFPNDDDNDDN